MTQRPYLNNALYSAPSHHGILKSIPTLCIPHQVITVY
jgi:hypothetical protein